MRSVELLLRIPKNWIGELSTSCDLAFKVLRCVPIDRDSGQSLIEIESPSDMTGTELADHIRKSEPACRINLTQIGPGKHMATVVNRTCVICHMIAETGCFLDSAESTTNGLIKWKILAPDLKSLNQLINKVKELGCEVEIVRISDRRYKVDLTENQERVLSIANKLGYFDIPKKITLDELASKLDIAKSTLDIVLRRAERKLIRKYLNQTNF